MQRMFGGERSDEELGWLEWNKQGGEQWGYSWGSVSGGLFVKGVEEPSVTFL